MSLKLFNLFLQFGDDLRALTGGHLCEVTLDKMAYEQLENQVLGVCPVTDIELYCGGAPVTFRKAEEERTMIEEIRVVPEIRIVVLQKIEQTGGRPPKYLVEFGGEVELMAESTLQEWRKAAAKPNRNLQHIAALARSGL